jgi:hypothetical protein
VVDNYKSHDLKTRGAFYTDSLGVLNVTIFFVHVSDQDSHEDFLFIESREPYAVIAGPQCVGLNSIYQIVKIKQLSNSFSGLERHFK